MDLTQKNLVDESGLPRPTKGHNPQVGGERILYDLPAYWMFFQPEYQGIHGLIAAARAKRIRGPRKGTYPVVFINGMQPTPEKHKMQALATSAVTGGPVWGIYNAGNTKSTTSTIDDLKHCVDLKTTSSFRREISAGIDRILEAVTGASGLAEQNLREFLQKDDPSSATLFDSFCSGKFSHARICAHSQGNIITCNALNAFVALKGRAAIANMKVYAFGSPVTFWSDANDIVQKHEFSNDAITWMAINRSSGTGVQAHGAKQMGVGWKTLAESEVPKSRNPFSVNPVNLLTHSYFLYLQQLWDAIMAEFQ